MLLSIGDKLGPYEILVPIGKGGMGEVYRAHDPRLQRDVAIKVSSEQFTERFEREARAVAALNHPNICQIYDVGSNYIVMELVEGESPKGPLPLETALNYAHQIADALEAAHDKGIVHRDLKPGNIKITPDGKIKVLDFGLAKVIPVEPGAPTENSPTLTMGATQAGVVLGTAAYMSPEQARGKTVDKRADIWAFGVVFFEVLTGRRPFEGEDLTETLASVVKEQPPIDQAPARVRRLLRKCLEKDPKKRLRDIGDAWELLDDERAPEAAAPSPSRLGWGIAAVLAVIAAVVLWGWLRPAPAGPRTAVRLSTTLPVRLGAAPGLVSAPVLSRDGLRVAFVGGPSQQIYVRDMDQLDAKSIPGTEGAGFLCFSPDGQWISFVAADGHLKKIAVAGGPAQSLAEAATQVGPPTQSWGADDNILFSNQGVLMRIPSAGGKPETLATPDARKGEAFYLGAQFLPEKHQILVGISSGSSVVAPPRVIALDPKTGAQKTLLEGVEVAQYIPSEAGSTVGYLVYGDLSNGSLMAVPFDARRLEVRGSAVPLIDGIRFEAGPFAVFTVSESGMLAYMPGVFGDIASRSLVWVDRKGVEQPLPLPPRPYELPRISPDGGRIAMGIQTFQGRTLLGADIWVYDIRRNALSRVTLEGVNITPLWTPDGKRLIYGSGTSALQVSLVSGPADGTTPPSPLINDGVLRMPFSISADGKLLIGHVNSIVRRGNDFWALSLTDGKTGGAKPKSFLDSRSVKNDAQVSPDGHWVAYQSNESGKNEIYVVPYPAADQKFPISTDGGTNPRWSRSGRELFYRSGNLGTKMMAVDLQTTPALRASPPRMLFEGAYALTSYDVSPDGQRFLMVKPPAVQPAPSDQLIVVVNWLDELRGRVPLGK